MCVLIKLIGVYLMTIGAIILLKPKTYNRILNFFRKGKRIYIAGIMRILFGVLLLYAAAQTRLEIFLLAVGILAVIGGILIFVLKEKKLQAMIDWFDKRPSAFIRFWGVAAFMFGALLIYSVHGTQCSVLFTPY